MIFGKYAIPIAKHLFNQNFIYTTKTVSESYYSNDLTIGVPIHKFKNSKKININFNKYFLIISTNIPHKNIKTIIDAIISINSNSSIDIYFHPNNDIDSLETIQIKVWPKDHIYLEKNISFNVYFQDIDFEVGDINNDLLIDVIDILIIVNHINENILIDNQFIYADLNYDQNIDILDIVLIIDIILNN